MVLMGAPGTGCSGSSVVARPDAPWSVCERGHNMPTALRDLRKQGRYSSRASECRLLVVIFTGDCGCSPKSGQTRPLTLLSGLQSGYAHIHRVFRIAVKVFGSGRDLCIWILDLKFSGWRIGPWLGFSSDQPESGMFQYNSKGGRTACG